MNQQVKTFLLIIAALLVAGASLAYGALTPEPQPEVNTSSSSATPKSPPVKPEKKLTLQEKLATESPTIIGVLTTKYPKIATDYTIINSKLYKEGEWFGALLQYKGVDTLNRDTLRVLMQKKEGEWILRTEPPEIILSAKKYKDVPKDILKAINQPVSLP